MKPVFADIHREILRRLRLTHALRRSVPKRVVYTSLFGKYETLNEQPAAKQSNIPFICFTDQPDLESETWNIRTVASLDIDYARESRRPKILPHLYLADFDESIYIDNTVLLKQAPESIFDEYLKSFTSNFVCFRHPDRDCAYDEAEVVIRNNIDTESRVREQMDHYRSRGLLPHSGLIAGTFLLRRHNAEDVRSSSELWFSHVLRYSKRDQLSFNFTASRSGLDFVALDLDLRANDIFEWPNHVNRLPYGFDDDLYRWRNPDVAKAMVDPRKHYIAYGRKEKRRFNYHAPIQLNILANRFKSDKGDLYYIRHFYSRVYEYFLAPLRATQFTLVEIGLLRHDVQAALSTGSISEAPSLYMWGEYFQQAQIHGVDIQDFSPVEGGRIIFTQADQSNRDDLDLVIRRSVYPLRVIIDDGSHASDHQQISFAHLFPHLASGGLYFIEDLHYQPPQWENPEAIKTLNFLQMLCAGQRPYSKCLTEAEESYLLESVDEIQFFDSMDYAAKPIPADALAVIRKR